MPPDQPATGYDPLDLQAQEAAKKAQGEASELQRRNELEDIRWLLSDKRGRRVTWRLLELTGVFRSTFHKNPRIAAFNEGMRNTGNVLLADMLEGAPARFMEMQEEHLTDARTSDRPNTSRKRKR